MADEPSDDDGREAQDITGRVDDLVANAVDRQIAEQRNLNRLLQGIEESVDGLRGRLDELQRQVAREIGPTLDRLGALDSGLRSLRESLSAQSVALRQELQETTGELREQVRSQGQASEEDLAALQRGDRELEQQLAALTQSLGTALERLDSRQGSLAGEVTGLAARLTDAAEAAEDTRDSLGSHTHRLEQAVEGLASTVAQQLAHHRDTVRDEIAELREVAARDREQVTERLDGAVGGLEQRLSGLEEHLSAHERALGELGQRVEETVGGAVGTLREELGQRVEQAVGGAVERLRSELAGEVAGLTARVTDATAVAEDTRESLGSHTQRLEQRLSGLEEHLSAHERALGELGQRVEETVGGAVGTLREELGQRVEQVEQTVGGALGTLRGELGQRVEEAVGSAVEERFGALTGALDGRLAELRGELVDRLDRLTGEVAGEVRRAADDTAAVGDRMTGSLTQARAELTERVERVSGDVRELSEAAAGSLTDLRTATDELRQQLQTDLSRHRDELASQSEALHTAAGEVREHLREGLERVEGEVATRLEAHRAELLQRQGDQHAGLRELLDEHRGLVDAALAEVQRDLRRLLAEQGEAVEARVAEQVRAVADVAEQIRSATTTVTAELTELEALGTALTQTRQLEAEARDELREALLGGVDARLEQAVERLAGRVAADRDELAAVVADLRTHATGQAEEVSAVAVELRDAVRAALDGHGDRLDASLERLRGAVEDTVGEHGERVAAAAEQLRGAVDERLAGLEGHLGDLERRLAGVEDAATRSREAAEGVGQDVGGLDERVRELFAELQEGLLDAQRDVVAQLGGTVEDAEARLARSRELLDQAVGRIDGQAEQLEQDLAAALGRVAEGVRGDADAARQRLADAAAQLEGTFEHLRHLESALVAYLEVRDQHLEEERAGLLRAVLSQLGEGLSSRARRRLTANVEEAVQQVAAAGRPARAPTGHADAGGHESGVLLTELLRHEAGGQAPRPRAPEADADDEPAFEADADDESAFQAEADHEPVPEAVAGHVCEVCGFEARSAGGLASHRRVHRRR